MKRQSMKEHFREQKIVDEFKFYDEKDPFKLIIEQLVPKQRVLSLGCGSGREVKLLLKDKQKVIAVDFSKEMIDKSKQVEPRAEYYCMDAVDFVKKYKDKYKFDYVLGLFTLLCYIDKKDRKEFIRNCYDILDKKGQLIFTVHYYNNTFKDFIKSAIAPFLAVWYNEDYEVGDAYCDISKGVYTIPHHFTKGQIRKLFRGYDYITSGDEIRVFKNE